jgi:tetratricopeptide (TPR) repeat protein
MPKSPSFFSLTPNAAKETIKAQKYPLLGGVILALFSFLLYANTLNNDFALDDIVVVTQNAYTTKGFAGIGSIFTHDSIHGFQLMGGNETNLSYYRPLSLVTFAMQYQFWGAAPWVYHLGNVLIFSFTVVVFFRLLSFLGLSLTIAFAAAFIFALHPIHTECVANIKGRDELLSLLFYVLALHSGIYALRSGVFSFNKFKLWSLAAFFLALLSKENAVTFLAIFPLTLWVFEKKDLRSCLLATLPYGVVFIGYFAMRVGIIGLDLKMDADSIINNRFLNSDFSQKYGTISVILLHYWRMLFYPYPLVWDYSFNAIPMHSLAEPFTAFSILFHLSLLKLGLWLSLKRIALGFCILFIYGSLAIASGIIIDIGGFVGERFLYQGSAGFALLLALILEKPLSWFPSKFELAGWGAALGALALFAVPVTWARNKEWKNNETLLIADAYKTKGSALVYRNAANALIAKALQDSAKKEDALREAEIFLKKAIGAVPDYFDAWIDYCRLYSVRRQLPEAKAALEKAKSIYPVHFYIQQNSEFLASLYLEAGYKASQRGELAVAFQNLQEAVSLNPNNHHAFFGLGIVRARQGLFAEASTYFEKAASLNPNAPDYWYNLGLSAQSANNISKARLAFEKVIGLQPNYGDAALRLQNMPK